MIPLSQKNATRENKNDYTFSTPEAPREYANKTSKGNFQKITRASTKHTKETDKRDSPASSGYFQVRKNNRERRHARNVRLLVI